MTRSMLEWWPDDGGDLFFLRSGTDGSRLKIEDLGLPRVLHHAIRSWLVNYESRLPIDGPGDAA